MCSFCDQRTISGESSAPSVDEVRDICRNALDSSSAPENTEIAFFGGSFTAIPRDYMTGLLRAAAEFVGDGKFHGIRISTRPDYITPEILDILKMYGVTAIELGAQSMNDEVLEANERGHTAQDVVDSAELIRQYGFELGLQMMTGLYKSSPQRDMETARKIADIRPDTVRIYPVVVLEGTRLAQLYRQGIYEMMPLDDMARLCARMLLLFGENGIRVIKCGLHASEFVENDMVAGYYHPAFMELCEMSIYRKAIEVLLAAELPYGGKAVIEVGERCVSKAVGQKKANKEYFREKGYDISICGVSGIPEYQCRLRK